MSSTPDNGTGDGTASVVATGGTPFAGNTYQYQWNTAPQQLTSTAIGLVYGSYTVLVTDKNGCTCSGTVEVDKNFSLEDDIAQLITIYPNPSNGIVNLQIDVPMAHDVKMQVTNAVGQVITTDYYKNASMSRKQIDLSKVAKGVYYIQLVTDAWEYKGRVLVVE